MKSVREMRMSYKIFKYNFSRLVGINIEVRVLLKRTLKKLVSIVRIRNVALEREQCLDFVIATMNFRLSKGKQIS